MANIQYLFKANSGTKLCKHDTKKHETKGELPEGKHGELFCQKLSWCIKMSSIQYKCSWLNNLDCQNGWLHPPILANQFWPTNNNLKKIKEIMVYAWMTLIQQSRPSNWLAPPILATQFWPTILKTKGERGREIITMVSVPMTVELMDTTGDSWWPKFKWKTLANQSVVCNNDANKEYAYAYYNDIHLHLVLKVSACNSINIF